MITQTEKNLIALLKSLGLDKETTVGTSILLRTDENRQKMIGELCSRILDKGVLPSEQDIQKIGLILTGDLKEEYKDKARTSQ